MQPEAVHAFVAAPEPRQGRAAMGVVFVNSRGLALRRIGRRLPDVADRDLAAFRGIVYALWHSRRLGTRRVVVHCANETIVRQINGEADVPESLVGPYLEVRALLHAYRAARVEYCSGGSGDLLWQHEAQALADRALDRDVDETVEDLPLWSGTPAHRSTA
jgi:ribonuclease HI